MEEHQFKIRSAALQNERTVWVRAPADREGCDTICVFLDGEFYRDRVCAPKIIEDLQSKGAMRDAWIVYVSHLSEAARWLECPCHEPFATFVAEELWERLQEEEPSMGRLTERVLIGLSYTGLAASYVALMMPDRFSAVVSQSGSYWWNDEWLSRQLATAKPKLSARFYLDVGLRETQTQVAHRPETYQGVSQLDGVRGFRDAVTGAGAVAAYREFDGGHEMSGWASSLPHLLAQVVPVDRRSAVRNDDGTREFSLDAPEPTSTQRSG